jgi:hypothetical protein
VTLEERQAAHDVPWYDPCMLVHIVDDLVDACGAERAGCGFQTM